MEQMGKMRRWEKIGKRKGGVDEKECEKKDMKKIGKGEERRGTVEGKISKRER